MSFFASSETGCLSAILMKKRPRMKKVARHPTATLMDLIAAPKIWKTPFVLIPIFLTTKMTNDPKKEAPFEKIS